MSRSDTLPPLFLTFLLAFGSLGCRPNTKPSQRRSQQTPDMAGNVWEYVADEWRPYRPDSAAAAAPPVDRNYLRVTTRRVIPGGS